MSIEATKIKTQIEVKNENENEKTQMNSSVREIIDWSGRSFRVRASRVDLLLWINLLFLAVVSTVFFVDWSAFVKANEGLTGANLLPSLAHPLGTDGMGRDLLVRFTEAFRGGVLPLWLCGVGSMLSAVAIRGAVFAFDNSRVFSWIHRFMSGFSQICLSLPFGLVVFILVVLFESTGIGVLLASGGIFLFFKTYQQTDLLLSEYAQLGYWQAHEVVGGSRVERYIKYGLLSSFKRPLLSDAALGLNMLFVVEMTLSYLGFGIQEPSPSFGNILSSQLNKLIFGQAEFLIIATGVTFLVTLIPVSIIKVIDRPRA